MKKSTEFNKVTNSNSEFKVTKYYQSIIFFLFLFLMIGSIPDEVRSSPFVVGVDPGAPVIQTFDAATWIPFTPPIPLTMPGFTIYGANSVTWNSDDLLYYAIVKTGSAGGAPRRLVTVDPLTGVCADIGLLDQTSYSSMTFNSDLGIMYVMGGSGGVPGVAETLFRLDLTTAATTYLGGPYPVGTFGEVIAYNYDDDMIYHWSGGGPGMMEKIDPVTFIATTVPTSGTPFAEIQGAVYTGNGTFVVTDLIFGGATNAFTITSSGFAALVAPTPYRFRGLGFADPVLPVELTSFAFTVNANSVTLYWSTSTEINNSGFEIERSDVRSQTSNVWTKIGNISGNGTSATSHSYTFADRNLTSGSYSYRLKQIDFNGNFEYFNLSNEVIIGIPNKYELSQNYPNPFNPATNLEFGISDLGFVSLKVFNTSGKEVATIVNEIKPAGYYSVNFNGANLSSGIYFYTLKAADFVSTKKMLLVK